MPNGVESDSLGGGGGKGPRDATGLGDAGLGGAAGACVAPCSAISKMKAAERHTAALIIAPCYCMWCLLALSGDVTDLKVRCYTLVGGPVILKGLTAARVAQFT